MALPIWQRTITTESGDVIPGAEVEVVNEATGLAADIFSNRAGTTPRTNPFFTGADGFAQFYVAPGEYRITATGPTGSITWRWNALVGSAAFLDASNVGVKTYASVLEFGAVGDGVTDDAQAFIDALNAFDHVIVPDTGNEYIIDERIILSSGQRVTGLGMPTLKLKGKDWGNTNDFPAAIFVFPSNCNGAMIEALKLDGNQGNHQGNNLLNIECVECDGTNNTVQDCEIFDSQADGIDSDGDLNNPIKQGNKFLNNKIFDCLGWGIHNSIGSMGNICTGNEIFNCGFATGRGGLDSVDFPSTIFRSFGEHVIVANKVYSNRINFDIRGDNLSSFSGNIQYGAAVRSILTKATSPMRSFQNEPNDSLITGSVDVVRDEGVYSVNAATTGLPINAGGILTVLDTGIQGRVSQIITYPTVEGNLASRQFIRSYDGNLWGAWKEKTTSERGSNANGEFVRFSDGTMICTISRVEGPLAADVPTYQREWNFPAEFSTPPALSGSYNSTNSNFSGQVLVLARTGNANSTQFVSIENRRLDADFPSGATIGVRYIATGRWK